MRKGGKKRTKKRPAGNFRPKVCPNVSKRKVIIIPPTRNRYSKQIGNCNQDTRICSQPRYENITTIKKQYFCVVVGVFHVSSQHYIASYFIVSYYISSYQTIYHISSINHHGQCKNRIKQPRM